MLLEKVFIFESRSCHRNPQIFCFFASGHYASVIIGKHHNSFSLKRRVQSSLAGNKKIVAIY
jgi:hypothetical protein